MLGMFLLRAGLWTLAAVLGGFGIFFAILSCRMPGLSAHAVVLIGTALGINYCLAR